MTALQSSGLKLADDELSRLRESGFVISNRKRFPSFADGWLTIYKADLPLYVSADALLHVVHRSYDRMLEDLEVLVLMTRLQGLLGGMREHLAGAEGASLPAQVREDADLFTAVALGLLEGRHVPPAAGADAALIASLTDRAAAAQGMAIVTLFGSARKVDFSAFKPRGHYALDLSPPPPPPTSGSSGGTLPAGSATKAADLEKRVDELKRTIRAAAGQAAPPNSGAPSLRRYFQAMAWLGRIDARIAVPDKESRALRLDRRELVLACALRALMGDHETAAWKDLESATNTFVGERDAMGPADIDRLLADVGVKGLAGLGSVADDKLLAKIMSGKYGEQRITGDIFYDDDHKGPTPLPRSFSFTGQRYVPDAHVLSEVVHDRVPYRLMPSPLDVAFAVLANDKAKDLLHDDLDRYHYAATLEGARDRVGARGDAGWNDSLYDLWLGALRTLSRTPDAPLDPTMRTDAWSKRLLNTELASWAELRHDTVLYAKQSYTFGVGCSFPDAYVDPYPAFYEKLGLYATKGQAMMAALDLGQATALRTQMTEFFGRLDLVTRTLGHMAQEEERGARPSPDELAFVNGAVSEDPPALGCGPVQRRVHGWYIGLFYGQDDALAFKPTIADVHTQPTDLGGNPVGKVLHVGTGSPRTMVVNLDLGGGPRPFVGVVSTYNEVVTENFQRYTDEEWRRAIAGDNAEDVPWMRDIVVR